MVDEDFIVEGTGGVQRQGIADKCERYKDFEHYHVACGQQSGLRVHCRDRSACERAAKGIISGMSKGMKCV